MAIPVARVHLAMAHAALPALLPTPPNWKMMAPLLSTPAPPPRCVVILPMPPPPKPGRADAVERWDANKTVKPAATPTSSSGSSGQRRTPDGKSKGNPGRASACERWDRDTNKTRAMSSSSSGRSRSPSRVSSDEKWSSSKRRPALALGTGSRASSSSERWDAHKKPRPQAGGIDDDDDSRSSTGSSNGMELDDAMPLQRAFYAGPGFLASSPEPSMLPMPWSLMVRAAA